MKKVIKKVSLLEMGESFKYVKNAQSVASRVNFKDLMVHNVELGTDISFNMDKDNNRLIITIDNFKVNDCLVIHDDSGIAAKGMI